MRVLQRVLGLADRLAGPEGTDPSRHWQRIALMRAVDERIAGLEPATRSAAEISGDTHASKPWREYESLEYPEFDLCAPLQEGHTYDVVICEQVLEHVEDPCAAVANLRDLCVPGGEVIVSTPFLVRVHELEMFLMRDYWRFTPRGLRKLLEQAGLEVDEVGSWGNRECVVGNFNRWPQYTGRQSLENEPDFPLQVWAFANRPREA